MTETDPKAPNGAKVSRAQRIFEALIGGAGVEAISVREKLTQKRVEAIVRDALGRRWVLSLAEFARLQIARLEALSVHALKRAQAANSRRSTGRSRSSTGSTAITASTEPAPPSNSMARRSATVCTTRSTRSPPG
jgi:hypothetical protein